MQPGCLMKILEAERWLKGTNFRKVRSSNGDKTKATRALPIRGLVRWKDVMHGESAKTWLPSKGVALLLKATLPTCVLSRRRLSLHQHAPRSSPTTWGLGPTRHASWPRTEEAKPPRAVRATAQRLQALLHFHPDQRVKGRTAMQAACNRTKGAHPFDFDASGMEAQAHTSCNRCTGYYVRETAPPLAPVPHLLDCGTGAATRANPAHGPTMPTEHIGHGSISHGRRRDD
jgi:hypothetical protein